MRRPIGKLIYLNIEDSKPQIKLQNGMSKLRTEFKSEYDWLEYCSENGDPDLQIAFSSHILSTRKDEQRVVEAYKWAFISRFLGNSKGADALLFIRLSMSDQQVLEADALVEHWAGMKQTEFLEGKTENWSIQLNENWAQTKRQEHLH